MGKYNLWLDWEAYKMAHPEARQVLEWQERYYSTAVVNKIGHLRRQKWKFYIPQKSLTGK